MPPDMTAIGFLLFLAGFGHLYVTRGDSSGIYVAATFVGAGLIVSGVAVKLWQAMP